MSTEYLARFQEITLQILEYYTDAIQFDYHDVDRAMEEIDELERKSEIRVPFKVHEIFSSLYVTLAKGYISSKPNKAVDLFRKGIYIREKILRNEPEVLVRAENLLNLGSDYDDLAKVRDLEENLHRAIKAYQEALTIYTKEEHPIKYADTQNALGIGYWTLAEVRDAQENLEKTLRALQEALTIYTKETHPIDYAMTQNCVGGLYGQLSEAVSYTHLTLPSTPYV